MTSLQAKQQHFDQIEAAARESLRMVPPETRSLFALLLRNRFEAGGDEQPIYALAIYGLERLELNLSETEEESR